ncbi:MAG: hypothetical protein HYZ34_11430 [Ignavibacteriae bacterium]|nr:hypothetical protein [Ignavibacteriota bacterium]
MSYIVRNTIVLGVGLLIILGMGIYFTMVALPKKLEVVDAEIKRIENLLQNTPDLANEYNTRVANLDSMKHRWNTRDKEFPSKDISGQTYGYFNSIIGLSGEVKMNMIYKGERDSGKYGFNEYNLKGEALFGNFYRFIWYIENGARLFKLTSLKFSELERKDSLGNHVFVSYEMDLNAYYSTNPELNKAPTARAVTSPPPLAMNPIYPLIMKEIPEIKPDEIDIRSSDLKAVIPGKAFIIDQANRARELVEGDPVYLGNVVKILPELGKIECILIEGGVTRTVELYIRRGESINK